MSVMDYTLPVRDYNRKRKALIVKDKQGGHSYAYIAKKYNLSELAVHQLLYRERKAKSTTHGTTSKT